MKFKSIIYDSWLVISPVILAACCITTSIMLHADIKDDIGFIKQKIESHAEESVQKELADIANTGVPFIIPVINDERLTQAGTGASSITAKKAAGFKQGIIYPDISKYNRAGMITAVINASNLQSIQPFPSAKAISTVNLLPEMLGGTQRAENIINIRSDVYKNIYLPIMQYIYDYIFVTDIMLAIQITPTYSNVDYQMPDTIRIDIYSLADRGQTVNLNYVIADKSTTGNTDYINLDNN